MSYPNKYPGACSVCRARVEVGAGFAYREGGQGGWLTRHAGCQVPGAPEAPFTGAVRFTIQDGGVVAGPTSYLGGDRFARFKAALMGAGATYRDATKTWHLGAASTVKAALDLLDAGFTLQADDLVREALAQRRDGILGAAQDVTDRVTHFAERGVALRGYQAVGSAWLASQGAAILADEMGLGKTIQEAMSWPEGAPVVVVAPASVKGTWRREVTRWRHDYRVSVLAGRGSFRWPEPGEVVVTNPDILPSPDADLGPAPEGLILVADEAHAYKGSTKRTRAMAGLCKSAADAGGRRDFLTGTPLLNRPQELWTLLSLLGVAGDVFGTKGRFIRMVERHDPEVPRMLSRVMLRRTKVQVARDLPSLEIVAVPVDADGRVSAELDDLLARHGLSAQDIADAMEGAGREIEFSVLAAIRACLAKLKIPAMLELVEEYEESEEPVVVASAHLAPLDALRHREGWGFITGGESLEERERVQAEFQAGRLKGVGLTIQAGGVGITLTRACQMLVVDETWVPGINEQAYARIHRIGQDRPVQIRVMVAAHPVDERVAEVQDRKRTLVAATVQATSTEDAVSVEVAGLDRVLAAIQPPTEAAQVGVWGSAPKAAPRRRAAQTERERWAARAILTLAGMDQDGARVLNGAGFNRLDTGVGREMAGILRTDGLLTPGQWALVGKIAARYPRQVGRFEEVVT